MRKRDGLYNPFDAAHRANPYPALHATRAHGAVVRLPEWQGGQWVVTGYQEVRRLLTSEALVADDLPQIIAKKAAPDDRIERFVENTKSWLFFVDGEIHKRLRSIVQKRFAPAKVGQLRALVREKTTRLVESAGHGEIDVMKAIARPLPNEVIGTMLGLPEGRAAQLLAKSSDLFRTLVPPQSLATYIRLDKIVVELEREFTALLAAKRRSPQDDLLSDLASADAPLGEVLGLALMLFSVGQDTTENLIGNGLLALLSHPDQWELLQADPTLAGQAADEAARFDTPVQGVARRCVAPVSVGDTRINTEDRVILMLAGANRDAAYFSDPDSFQIARKERSSLPFGGGAHFCLGAHLAKLIAEEAFRELASQSHKITLGSQQLAWRNVILLRSLCSLPVTIEPVESSVTTRPMESAI